VAIVLASIGFVSCTQKANLADYWSDNIPSWIRFMMPNQYTFGVPIKLQCVIVHVSMCGVNNNNNDRLTAFDPGQPG